MNRFVITLTWHHPQTAKAFVRASWDSPHGPIHTFCDLASTELAAENEAVAAVLAFMTRFETPFTHLEIVRV